MGSSYDTAAPPKTTHRDPDLTGLGKGLGTDRYPQTICKPQIHNHPKRHPFSSRASKILFVQPQQLCTFMLILDLETNNKNTPPPNSFLYITHVHSTSQQPTSHTPRSSALAINLIKPQPPLYSIFCQLQTCMHLSSWMWAKGKYRIMLTSFILNLWPEVSRDHLHFPPTNLPTCLQPYHIISPQPPIKSVPCIISQELCSLNYPFFFLIMTFCLFTRSLLLASNMR